MEDRQSFQMWRSYINNLRNKRLTDRQRLLLLDTLLAVQMLELPLEDVTFEEDDWPVELVWETMVRDLNKQLKGFSNRIGKAKLVTSEEGIVQEDISDSQGTNKEIISDSQGSHKTKTKTRTRTRTNTRTNTNTKTGTDERTDWEILIEQPMPANPFFEPKYLTKSFFLANCNYTLHHDGKTYIDRLNKLILDENTLAICVSEKSVVVNPEWKPSDE